MSDEIRKQNIRLHLFDTDIAIKVLPEEEELYRNAAKLINETVNTYNNMLKGKRSDKEIIYASMLDIAWRFENELKRNDTLPYEQLLDKLTEEVEAEL